MTELPKQTTPPAPADQSVADLPPEPTPEQTQPTEVDSVKGGLGINRIVVTDGQIKP
jgi:hypothetical protein